MSSIGCLMGSGITIYTFVLITLLVNNNNLSYRMDKLYASSDSHKLATFQNYANVSVELRDIKNNYVHNKELINKQYELLERTRMRVNNLKSAMHEFDSKIKNVKPGSYEERYRLALSIINLMHNITLSEHETNADHFDRVESRLRILENKISD